MALVAGLLPQALPGQTQETEDVVVFGGYWRIAKAPDQQGTLVYLNRQSAKDGDGFGIVCKGKAASGYLRALVVATPRLLEEAVAFHSRVEIEFSVDGQGFVLPFLFSAHTEEIRDAGGLVAAPTYGYVGVAGRDETEALLTAMRRGSVMKIEGQVGTIDLRGVTAALKRQEQYCP